MAINNLTHFVLVDFENVPGIDLSVLGNHPAGVTLFLGPRSKLKPALVEQITTLPFEVRLIKIGHIKKNAVDFVLAYHLGEMVSRYPRGHYYIVSKDQDYEPLVTHLRDHNIHISQHKDTADLPFLAPAKLPVQAKPDVALKSLPPTKTIAPAKTIVAAKLPAPVSKAATAVSKPPAPVSNPPDARPTKIIARLKDPKNTNRATTRKALHAYIKNSLGKETAPEKVDGIIFELIQTRVLTINAKGKIAYNGA